MTQLGSQGHQGPSNPIFPTIPKSMSDLRGWFNWGTQVTNYLRSYVVDFDPPGVVTGFKLSGRTIGYQLAWNLVPKARSYSVLRGTTSDPAAATVITRLVGKDNVSYLDVVDQVTLSSPTLYYWVYAENLMGLAGPVSEMLSAANRGLTVGRVVVFTESGTWEWVDEGSVLVFLVGGGGGGGGAGGARGGGGGAGGEVVERIIATNSGDDVTVTIGTGSGGGAGSTGTGTSGTVGVNSSFGTLRARGGNGGTGGAAGGGGSDPGGVGGTAFATGSPFGINAAGGQGGTDGGSSGSDGNTAAGLAAGGDGGTGSSTANQGAGGGGAGSTGLGADGGDSNTDNAAVAADNTGGGGGGGGARGSSNAGYAGKAGGSGMCIVISQGTD